MDRCHSLDKEEKIDMFKIPSIENKIKKQQKIRALPKSKQKFSHTKIDNMAKEWEDFMKTWGSMGAGSGGTYTVFVGARCSGKTQLLRRALEGTLDDASEAKGK